MRPFISLSSGRIIFRSIDSYQVPQELEKVIEIVHGISNFPPQSLKSKTQQAEQAITEELLSIKATPYTAIFYQVMSRAVSKLTATFFVVCPNGQIASTSNSASATSLCSNAGATLTMAMAFANGYLVDLLTIQQLPACHLSNKVYICSMTFQQVQVYNTHNISVELFFSNPSTNLTGPTNFFGYPVVSTPLILVNDVQSQYNIPFGARVIDQRATQCVAEFEQQYYSPSDLELFFANMGVDSGTNVTVIGPNDSSNPGAEANLDIQWIMGLAPGSPTTFWSIAANSTIEIDDILTWEYAIANSTNPPLVNSLSYGMTEMHVDIYLGAGYLARSDAEFAKLAALGLTVIIADGDSGSIDMGLPPMSQVYCQPLHADWPSQSPFVTAVSSTFITPNSKPFCYPDGFGSATSTCQNNVLGEVAVSVDAGLFWTTGGGFSNTSSRPFYQESVVQGYLNSNQQLPPLSYFNYSGRAYPDISTNGHNLVIALGGRFGPVDGTSASAPIFGAIVSLLNDVRFRHGKTQLGLINPLLYLLHEEYPTCFNDVVVGHNSCGDQGFYPVCCPYGFWAQAGWDPVTGLGTPNFGELSKAVLLY